MRYLFSILIVLLVGGWVLKDTDMVKSVLQHIDWLSLDSRVSGRFGVNEFGVYYLSADNRREFGIGWQERERFLRFFNRSRSVREYDALYRRKDSVLIMDVGGFSSVKRLGGGGGGLLSGCRIGLDAGKFAADMSEALNYDRSLALFHKDSLGLKEDKVVMLSMLNYDAVMIIKDILERKGAEVILSRTGRYGLMGKVDDWFQNDYVKWVGIGYQKGWLNDNEVSYYLSTTKSSILGNLYKKLDMRLRAERLNDAGCDVVVSVSFNFDFNAEMKYAGLYTPISNRNYSMALIPGGFRWDELNEREWRIDYIRLMLSESLDESGLLANEILTSIEGMGIMSLGRDEVPGNMFYYAKPSSLYNGVFHRNLFITRSIYSPVVVICPMLLNNRDELLGLSKVGRYQTKNGDVIQVPVRVIEVSKRIADGIERYFVKHKRA